MPAFEYFDAAQRTIMFSEAYAIHESDLKTRPMAYGNYAYQHLVSGAMASAADYIQALRLRTELTRAVNEQLLGRYDSLLAPNSLVTAAAFEDFESTFSRFGGVMTGPFNVTGNPVLAVPIGFAENGLPLGAQLVGRPFDEAMLFRIGAAYEAATQFNQQWPSMSVAANAA